FGAKALPHDRRTRLHRLRRVAEASLEQSPAAVQVLYEAYAGGVNTGLKALAAAPFEYTVLQATPAPWRAEDSFLVVLAMFLTLHDEEARLDSDLGVLRDVLPPALSAFLTPAGGPWDAPLDHSRIGLAPLPGPEVVDLRQQPAPRLATAPEADPAAAALGSNNWAVAGSATAHGGAILAGDMHLPLRVPNIWYRAQLRWPGDDGEHRVTGVTLPGIPYLIAGSNGHIAWTYTNSYGDWADLIELEQDPAHPDHYLSPAGWEAFQHIPETLVVKDGPAAVLDILLTRWGPVIDRDHRGHLRALRWVAHFPHALNAELGRLETATNVVQALDIANRSGIPAQNILVADRDGHIGWTVMGIMPRRGPGDSRVPLSWREAAQSWDGWLEPARYPRLIDPPGGRLWTANARVLGGAAGHQIGDGGYALGARAHQIRNALAALPHATETDMLAIQLDDRALFLAPWRELLLALLDEAAVRNNPRRADCKALVEHWQGRAATASAGYRLVRAFRLAVAQRVLGALTAPARAADERFDYLAFRRYEIPLWRIVSTRPAHLLPAGIADWRAWLLQAVDEVITTLSAGGRPLAAATWGRRNTLAMQHPFSRLLPLLSPWLDMPAQPLPGDRFMPRVQGPTVGASQRLAVSPGREELGYFHMPGGQSGHPLSPFYRRGHEDWASGTATPFLPGPAAYTLTLRPAAAAQ
ncbi:MAG TPA: penicillin acylase family protein, partial [Gammaproteobacteria bacterium]|nr:penicillin acylase family protein [Gammaproteobacteria bacterium]